MPHWIKREVPVCTSDMICKASRVFASTSISDDPQLIDVMSEGIAKLATSHRQPRRSFLTQGLTTSFFFPVDTMASGDPMWKLPVLIRPFQPSHSGDHVLEQAYR